MSPPSDREEDSRREPAPSDARTAAAMPVCGAAEVLARLEQCLSRSRRRGSELAVLWVGVDRIVRMDGELDVALEQRAWEEVANRIGHAVRGSDVILRENERDTCVVLPGANAAVAARVARRLRRLLDGDYRVGTDLLQVSVRIGEAARPQDGSRAAELLRRASGRG